MTVAMQQMGIGGSQIETLAGFLDFPSSGAVRKHLTKVESVLGPVQREQCEMSKEEAIKKEIEAAKKNTKSMFAQ